MTATIRALALALLAWLPWSLPAAEPVLAFEDVTASLGLSPHLKGWQLAHAAAWGDADGDGRPDLYLGAFADRPAWKQPGAAIPNPLFLNRPTGFILAPDETVRMAGRFARTTMAFFADLDNDGDLDLFAGNHAAKAGQFETRLYENRGAEGFVDRTPTGGDWPAQLGIRNASALDLDRDGRLDLLLTDGNYGHWHTDGGQLILLRQQAPWQWQRVSDAYGLPPKSTVGMGTAIGDLNDDGWPDFFVADGNQLLVSQAGPKWVSAEAGKFPRPKENDTHTCGAVFGDLNGDGRLDLVTTVHGQPASLQVYLNDGNLDGLPRMRAITAELGLTLPWPRMTQRNTAMKLAQVAIEDMDNDGRADLYLAVVVSGPKDQPQPLVLRNLGNDAQGLPRLAPPPLDRLLDYSAAGPVADFDGDGRLDCVIPNWHATSPFYLFRNVTAGSQWLTVRVAGDGQTFNRQGIGATVKLWRVGAVGQPGALLGRRDIYIGNGYSSGELAEAHFGLGAATEVAIEVLWQGQRQLVPSAQASQRHTVSFPAK